MHSLINIANNASGLFSAFPEYDKQLIEQEILEDIKEDLMEDFQAMEEKDAEKAVEQERRKKIQKINKDFENPISNILEDSVE